jgi:hypothetical protein
MLRLTVLVLACSLSPLVTTHIIAQTKTIPGEHETMTAKVEAIEHSTRTLTLRDPKGDLRTVKVPEDVKRFSDIKVGDTITATYYENINLRVKAPGEPDVDTLNEGVTPVGGAKPAGTAAIQRTITATIDAIDLNVPSISFKGPRGWAYSTKVQDKKALQQVKVGDRVDITWTEAMLVSVAPPAK